MTKILKTIKDFIPCCYDEFNENDIETVVKITKALGNEARFEIYNFLKKHNVCMTSDLVSHLPLAQSTISQHLKVMKDAGIIIGEIQGTSTNYCIDKNLMNRYKKLISQVL
jgi:ArsR family transcriptional regulator